MESKKKLNRSRAYPSITLEDALSKVSKINKNLGVSGSYNRETIVTGMGYSGVNGASARAAAALVQYGLLDRDHDRYSLSGIAKSYVLPINDSAQQDVKREAALRPKLFADIFSRFSGQVIPRQFVNQLVVEFGIAQAAANEVGRIFRETMTTAGLLNVNGVLTAIMEDPMVNETSTSKEPSHSPTPSNSLGDLDSLGTIIVDYDSGIKIVYPASLAEALSYGEFGPELKALNNKIKKYTDSGNDLVPPRGLEEK